MPSLVTAQEVALIWMSWMRCGAGESDALGVTCERGRQKKKVHQTPAKTRKWVPSGRRDCQLS